MGLLIYPGIWKDDFATYANTRTTKKHLPKNFALGGIMLSFIPLVNFGFVLLALNERFLYWNWKKGRI
jgi:hypothetical protein